MSVLTKSSDALGISRNVRCRAASCDSQPEQPERQERILVEADSSKLWTIGRPTRYEQREEIVYQETQWRHSTNSDLRVTEQQSLWQEEYE
jgi:hypothetical protein